MMINGYIKLHRSILDWEWWSDIPTFRVFMTLLLMCNINDYEFMGHTIYRGQMVTSYPSLSQQTNLSIMQVRRAIKNLKATGEITVKKTNKFSVITINNYEKFQAVTGKTTGKTVTGKITGNTTGNVTVKKSKEALKNQQKNQTKGKMEQSEQQSKKQATQHQYKKNIKKGVSKDTHLKKKPSYHDDTFGCLIPEGMTEEEYKKRVEELMR